MPPEPRANPLLLGHEPAEAALARAMEGGRLHHAWLISGPEGVGKATLAFRFARRLLAGGAPGAGLALDAGHPVFRRVAAGTHADLMTIERTYDAKAKRLRRQIAVDEVRRIPEFMSLTPAEGGWRVVVLDGAEDLNPNSANALLKVLEEPPPRAVLLLVCATPGRLLPTIRSRCRALRLAALPGPVLRPLLEQYLPQLDTPDLDRLMALSNGSPGRALMLAEEGGLRVAELVRDVLASVPSCGAERAYAVADALGRDDAAFGHFMDLLRDGIAASVRALVMGGGDDQQARLAALRPLDEWGDVWHALTRIQDETERFNLDKRHAIVAGLGLLDRPAGRARLE